MPYRNTLFSRREAPCRVLSGLLLLAIALVLAALLRTPAMAQGGDPGAYLTALDELFYLEQKDPPLEVRVRNHLVPLGAIQKVHGKWSPRESERITGQRIAYTWRVDEGFSAEEVVEELERELAGDDGVEALFACEGISCGSSVQWANRIFAERVLYGTQDSQLYRVYTITRGEDAYRLLIYASARSVDRQYVRAELLTVEAVNQ